MLLAGLPYFIRLPAINCLKEGKLQVCEESDVCTMDSKYIFDYSNFRSVNYEWHLICEDSNMIYYMIGVFISCLIISTLGTSFMSERYGRIFTLRWCLGFTSLFEFFLLGSADSYYFTVFLGLLVLPLQGTYIAPLVYVCEVTTGFSRTFALSFLLLCFACGYLPAYFLVFYMKSWRPVVLASLISGTLSLLFSFLLVESPRYLGVIRARYSKARQGLEYISKVNKTAMFEDHLQGEILNEYSETIRKRQGIDMSGLDNSELPEFSEQRDAIAAPFEYLGGAANAVDRERDLDRGQKYNFLDLFKEDLRKIVLFMMIIWMVLGCSAYSVSHSAVISNDEQDNVGSLVALTAAGIILTCVIDYFVPSKKLIMAFLGLTGVITVVHGALVFTQNANPALFSFVLVLIAGSIVHVFKYSIELMPTPSRSLGLGLMQFCMICGMIVGYFIVFYASAGIMAFGVVLTLTPILLVRMPDTSGKSLNDFAAWSMI